jgi:hypothetical protein
VEGRFLLWACIAAAVVGLAVGLRFRVPMLLFTAIIICAVTVGIGVHSDWSAYRTIAITIRFLAIEQVFYLAGLFAASRR